MQCEVLLKGGMEKLMRAVRLQIKLSLNLPHQVCEFRFFFGDGIGRVGIEMGELVDVVGAIMWRIWGLKSTTRGWEGIGYRQGLEKEDGIDG